MCSFAAFLFYIILSWISLHVLSNQQSKSQFDDISLDLEIYFCFFWTMTVERVRKTIVQRVDDWTWPELRPLRQENQLRHVTRAPLGEPPDGAYVTCWGVAYYIFYSAPLVAPWSLKLLHATKENFWLEQTMYWQIFPLGTMISAANFMQKWRHLAKDQSASQGKFLTWSTDTASHWPCCLSVSSQRLSYGKHHIHTVIPRCIYPGRYFWFCLFRFWEICIQFASQVLSTEELVPLKSDSVFWGLLVIRTVIVLEKKLNF